MKNEKLVKEEPDKLVPVMRELADLKAIEAALVIANRLDMRILDDPAFNLPSADQLYPAIRTLEALGESSIPSIVDSIAATDRSDIFVRNAIEVVWRLKQSQKAAVIAVFQAACDKRLADGKTGESERLKRALTLLASETRN